MIRFDACCSVDVDVTPQNWAASDYFMAIRAVHLWADAATAQSVRNRLDNVPPATRLGMGELVAITVGVGKPGVVFRMLLTGTMSAADVSEFAGWVKGGLYAAIAAIPSESRSELAKAQASAQ